MKIAILDDYQDVVRKLDCFSVMQLHDVTVFNDTVSEIDQLQARLADKDAVVLIRERSCISEALLNGLPRLRLISQTGKISNHLDLSTCSRHGVAVAEGRGSPVAPSELCWALIMAASRHIVPYARYFSNNHWQYSGALGLGRTLSGLTLGIWGYGKIGRRIAQFGKAFGMNILIWGREASRQQAIADGFSVAASKAALFQQSDILSLHLRLNAVTRHCVTAADLELMKNDALFVNISRAELVESGALVNALQSGKPGYAAVDVYENEPVNKENEILLNMENVLCSPHLGYVEKNSYELYFSIAFENVNAFFNGNPQHIANPEVL